MFDLPWDKPPEFVNEKGFKWWQDTETTGYAQKKNHKGKKLDAVCWFVEEPNRRRTRILVSKKGRGFRRKPVFGRYVLQDRCFEVFGITLSV